MIAQGLYDPANEHDACGVGFVAHIKGNKSHSIIEQGLLILKNRDHRGAVGADALMGDGAGILLQIPDQFYRDEMAKQGIELPPPGEYGVGMIFLPKEHASRIACEQEIERAVRAEGQVVLGWRNVPVDDPESLNSDAAFWNRVADIDADLAGEGRVLVRPSGTEPLVRVMVEATEPEVAEEAASRLVDLVEHAALRLATTS